MTSPLSREWGETGRRAEEFAANYLKTQGYRIIDTNVRFKLGELDLVAFDGDTLAFVEVRARRHSHFGTAAESVGYRKQRKVSLAVQLYLQERQIDPRLPVRIDVVAIGLDQTGAPATIDLIKDAFSD